VALQDIAEDTGLSKRSVQDAIAWLPSAADLCPM
jgi:hypothetical protein